MKAYLIIILLCCCTPSIHGMSWPIGSCNLNCGTGGRFSNGRTGQQLVRIYNPKGREHDQRKQTVKKIDFEDFERHLQVGTDRTAIYYDASEDPIVMNIKEIDADATAPQDWFFPDLSAYPSETASFKHVNVDNRADGIEAFPEATHAIYSEEFQEYQYYELGNIDLFHLGNIETNEEGEEEFWDYYTSISPVPLEVGEGIIVTVTFEYDDPEMDSIVWQEDYDVIGYGTLHLPNGETSEGVKLIYSVLENIFKNGEIVEESYYEEIVWYSKDGHYIRAGIENAWETEGKAELSYLIWQSISNGNGGGGVTALGNEQLQANTYTYPNPLASGQQMNIRLPESVKAKTLVLYNAQGAIIGEVPMRNAQMGNFQVQLPQNLSAGLYFYKVQNLQGEDVVGGRVLIE